MPAVLSTVDAMISAGRLTLAFGRVDRITFHPDGLTPESDTDHTVMLGVIACAIADQYFPDLNVGLIAQYALVHDLVETYAGDTPTLRAPTADVRADKQAREDAAYQRIAAEFRQALPWLPLKIAAYETRALREARFVKAVDKMMPKITHLLNGAIVIRDQGVSRAELAARLELQVVEMQEYAAEFPALFHLYDELVRRLLALVPEVPEHA